MSCTFRDRRQAGRLLAELMSPYRDRAGLLVLALKPQSVVVANEVARALKAPLDLFTVRKILVAGDDEHIMAMVSQGPTMLKGKGFEPYLETSLDTMQAVLAMESRRVKATGDFYRGDRRPVDVRNRCVILVDDGMDTGQVMLAAAEMLRPQRPAVLVAAVPMARDSACRLVRPYVDDLVCGCVLEPTRAVVGAYDTGFFSDDQVLRLLEPA